MDPENCPAELANAPCGELFGHVIRFNPMDKLRDAWPQRGMMLCLAVLEDGSVEVIEPLVPHFDRPMPEHELSLQEGGETAESWDAMKASLKATSSLFIAIFEQRHGACHEADRIRMNFPLRDQKSCSMWPSINLGKSYRRNIPIDWLKLKHLLTGILELYFSIWSKKMDFFLKKRYPSYVRSRILITSAFLGVSLPSAAHCETADDNATAQLEEITVIAQRTRENLQSVPISVSTVSDERLETVGIVSVSSLSTVVSGLSINATAQSFSPT
ncbi:hypothetical protein OKA06_11535 [Novosphingobium sp. MW5]|nr:hypothetical protein [Novosphingobium sp. MW5]